MREQRTHNLSDQPLYNVSCKTCGLGAITNNLSAAQDMARQHIGYRNDHVVHVAGRDMLTQVISLVAFVPDEK